MNYPTQGGIPALKQYRRPLHDRCRYDFSDYGFTISVSLEEDFEVVPVRVDDEEAFLFFYPKADLERGRFALFNLHCFLKKTGSLEEFAHSLGESVRTISLLPTEVFGVAAKTYVRVIAMKDLFAGAAQVIDFIGGKPGLVVRDSHIYFQHRQNHYYTGMLHEPGGDQEYDALRARLFTRIRLI